MDDENGHFDIIIANSLFHHVQPELWNSFLKGFADLLKQNGMLLLSGWDESDDVAKKSIAPYTQKKIWPITSIIKNIKKVRRYEIIAEEVRQLPLPGFFDNNKIFMYYVLKRK